MAANYWRVFGWAALPILSGNGAGGHAAGETVDSASAHITVLYESFGQTSAMQKDWGYAALVEYGGKRILFDTGKQAGYPRAEYRGKRHRSF